MKDLRHKTYPGTSLKSWDITYRRGWENIEEDERGPRIFNAMTNRDWADDWVGGEIIRSHAKSHIYHNNVVAALTVLSQSAASWEISFSEIVFMQSLSSRTSTFSSFWLILCLKHIQSRRWEPFLFSAPEEFSCVFIVFTRASISMARKRKALAFEGEDPYQDVRPFKRSRAFASMVRDKIIEVNEPVMSLATIWEHWQKSAPMLWDGWAQE
jgi:hypothetical protein